MDLINTEVLKWFALVGIMALTGLIVLIFWALFEWVKEELRIIKINRMIKHRFDGKPIAKCWCRDCRMHNMGTGACSLPGVSRCTPDNGFCYEADPLWREFEK